MDRRTQKHFRHHVAFAAIHAAVSSEHAVTQILKCPVIIGNSEEMLNISFWLHVVSAVESLWSWRPCCRSADAHKHGLCFAITERNLNWMCRGAFGWQDNLRCTLPICEPFCSLDWCAFSSLQFSQRFSESCPCGSAEVLKIGIKSSLKSTL